VITPEQLDAALGHGRKLTELVNSARHNPHKGIEFRTDWDDLLPEPEDHGDDGKQAALPSPADLVEGNGTASQPQDRGHRQGQNYRPKL
jgi:hypothetical protein